jgi:sulfatase maturation enzyme AslB (radical SAM superfamily)|tara:strand:- start:105 stop:1208 length:1104 start_codon:yes stop_codon:yes gene_type:complete
MKRTEDKNDITRVFDRKDLHSIIRRYNDSEAYDDYRELWKKSGEFGTVPDFPIQLDFELNYSCNFRCPMCTWSAEVTGKYGKETWFDFDVYKEVIDEGVKKGLKCIRLNYINEPLIRKDLVKFIEYARTAGILDIYMSTNGSLLTEEISKRLVTSGLTRLQISLDAATKETFNIIRVGGNFDEVIANVNRFIKIRKEMKSELPTLRVNFVQTETNEHEVEDFIEYWKDKADAIAIQDLVNIVKPTDGVKVAGIKEFKCIQPFNHMAIRYNGDILPCCTFFGAELSVAKLKSKTKPDVEYSTTENIGERQSPLESSRDKSQLVLRTIEETWKGPELKFLRDIHRKGEYWKHPVCNKCVSSLSHHDETQ